MSMSLPWKPKRWLEHEYSNWGHPPMCECTECGSLVREDKMKVDFDKQEAICKFCVYMKEKENNGI